MISERTFAEKYTSFWHRALPMGAKGVAAINNDLTHKFSQGRPLPEGEIRADLVSEISLRWLAARVVDGLLVKRRPSAAELARLAAEAGAFVALLKGSPTPELPPPSPAEIREAAALSEILIDLVQAQGDGRELIVPRPPFDGCGQLSACRGDLLVGQTLYEVKAVSDEGFQQPDLRQLVIYCALNFAAPRYDIRQIGLVNPRQGTLFRSDLEWIVQNLSGQEPVDLFYEILDFLSTERVSA